MLFLPSTYIISSVKMRSHMLVDPTSNDKNNTNIRNSVYQVRMIRSPCARPISYAQGESSKRRPSLNKPIAPALAILLLLKSLVRPLTLALLFDPTFTHLIFLPSFFSQLVFLIFWSFCFLFLGIYNFL